jgi:D-serine deaminase-like pyridoxal phosphate-dependent protein
MPFLIDAAAPQLVAEAFVRGERRRELALTEFRGSWLVVALAARRADILELAELEETFAADGAVVVAATSDDWYSAAFAYAGTSVRFPILTGVDESRRVTLIVDPGGVLRDVGLHRSGRETLAQLEAHILGGKARLAA